MGSTQRARRAGTITADRDTAATRVVAAGYHDRAHLTRESGRLAGETPGAWLQSHGAP